MLQYFVLKENQPGNATHVLLPIFVQPGMLMEIAGELFEPGCRSLHWCLPFSNEELMVNMVYLHC